MNENVKDRLLHRSYSYCIAPMIDLLERNFYALLIKSKFNIDNPPATFKHNNQDCISNHMLTYEKKQRQNKVNGIKETCSQPAYSDFIYMWAIIFILFIHFRTKTPKNP